VEEFTPSIVRPSLFACRPQPVNGHKTERFKKDFGHGHIRFSGLLIVGRDTGLRDYERFRLRWRTEKVSVDNHPVECITFDELYRHMDQHLKLNTGV
jgi:Domain of unknown function (DUF4263)